VSVDFVIGGLIHLGVLGALSAVAWAAGKAIRDYLLS